ncbi:MAG TPA: ABC transporter permease [Candidatus Acidoferrum sp.]|nr:ABC transporter permease [Candidatus Acidoferrum sp.]
MNLKFITAHSWLTGAGSLRSTWLYMISSIGFPLSLLFVVGVLSDGTLLPYALVGGLISVVATNGITTMADLGMFKFEYMYKDLIVATKTSPIDYMLGVMLADLFWSVPSIVIYFVLDIVFGILTPYSFVMTLAIAVLVLLSTASLGFLLTSLVKHQRFVWAITSLLSLAMMIFPPTFYPYKYLPKTILWILSISPTTPAAVLEQGVFGLAPTLWYMFPVLIAETVVFFLIAKYLTIWRER